MAEQGRSCINKREYKFLYKGVAGYTTANQNFLKAVELQKLCLKRAEDFLKHTSPELFIQKYMVTSYYVDIESETSEGEPPVIVVLTKLGRDEDLQRTVIIPGAALYAEDAIRFNDSYKAHLGKLERKKLEEEKKIKQQKIDEEKRLSEKNKASREEEENVKEVLALREQFLSRSAKLSPTEKLKFRQTLKEQETNINFFS